MRLAISSAAAADAPPQELVAACLRRGLSGIELVHDAASGLRIEEKAAVIALAAGDSGVELVGIHHAALPRRRVRAVAESSAKLGVPAIVPLPSFDRTLLGLAAEAFSEAGARLLLACGGDPEMANAVTRLLEPVPGSEAISLAWELRPGIDDPRFTSYVLSTAGDRLAYIRLFGGGPESLAQTGTGIGSTMAHLALARYSGPLVLVPSDRSYHYAWSAWLGRAGGWGCGSKQSDDALVSLATSSGAR